MKIIFAGTPAFALPTLQMLLDCEHQVCAVYTQPDRPAGRGQKLTASPVKQLAMQRGVPVYQPLNFKAAEDLTQLQAHQADLMVVVAYGLLLPQAVLDTPRLGCVNVHGSLLPRWRGAAPIHRALMVGDTATGITIMRVVKKLDAGDMLHKLVCPIGETDTTADLHDRLAVLGAKALADVLPQIADGTAVAEPQDEALVTYAHKLEKSEATIDWTQAAIEIERKVRGLNPWPVAQTTYQNQVLRIWRAAVLPEAANEQAGVVNCQHRQMDVATGQGGYLRILELQLPGGKRISAEAFLHAHSVDGVKLGL